RARSRRASPDSRFLRGQELDRDHAARVAVLLPGQPDEIAFAAPAAGHGSLEVGRVRDVFDIAELAGFEALDLVFHPELETDRPAAGALDPLKQTLGRGFTRPELPVCRLGPGRPGQVDTRRILPGRWQAQGQHEESAQEAHTRM